MKGFIEITRTTDHKKTHIAVKSIIFIESDKEGTLIVLKCCPKKNPNKPWTAVGLKAQESESEVIAKIEEATK